jgi:peptide/nickel transport system substrate-binding protein
MTTGRTTAAAIKTATQGRREMTIHSRVGQGLHPAALMYADEARAGRLSRREFLSRSTALGVSAAAAYGLLGLPLPARAQETPTAGGTLRMSMETRALKDPRTWDWSELANFARGWLDYMVEYQPDGTFRPMLLEGWEANEDATVWTLKVRQGVKWNNGDDFTAEDVVHNLTRWTDGTVEGNSMASRFAGLSDPATNQLREGAIEVVDPATVRLNLSEPDIAVIANMTDYPAAVVHQSYADDDFRQQAIGTGPLPARGGPRSACARSSCAPEATRVGHGVYGGPYLDRIEYIDYWHRPRRRLAGA